ncbi:MAG: hypothetical protein J6T30_04140, partial [Bacteroidales bacterium]|nr:hypothetical protein [Bacteroidales bacterium]
FGTIDTDILYDNMMNKFSWGGANDPKVNLDYSHQRNIAIMRARLNYTKLAKALASEGKYEKAVEVLDRCMSELPLEKIKYDSNVAEIVDAYFMSKEESKALDLVSKMCDHYYEEIEYYLSQYDYLVRSAEYYIQSDLSILSKAATSCNIYGKRELAETITEKVNNYYNTYLEVTK